MIPLTSTTKSIDGLLHDTARRLFEFISPKILLIGETDDHYEIIYKAYQWAVHTDTIPSLLDDDIALIVVNSRALFNQLVPRLPSDVAVLLYDNDELIPVAERNLSNPALLCYLRHISPTYLPGHVRVLLQLRKALVCVIDKTPYLLASDTEKHTMRHLVRTLDRGESAFVITPKVGYFFPIFKETVQLTHYESVCFVDRPDAFDEIAATKPTTLVLRVDSKAQFNAYKRKPLNQFSIIFIAAKRHWTDDEDRLFQLPQLGVSEDTFLLTSYYESLIQNLRDEQHRTRFIQRYTILDVMKTHTTISAYLPAIRTIFDAHSVKFRNIPIRVPKANYCVYPLDDLLGQFSDEIKRELLDQTNSSLYSMEMVSGIVRSTLMVRYRLR